MTDKTHLKTTMLALRAEQLRFAEQSYARYLAGAAGRGDEGGEAGASSQAHNSAVLAQSFECPIHTHEHALAQSQLVHGFSAHAETAASRGKTTTARPSVDLLPREIEA